MKPLESRNPYTNQQLETYQQHSPAEVLDRVQTAHETFFRWRKLTPAERGAHMTRLAQTLRDRKKHLAALITAEMGKLSAEAEAEVEKCAWVCEYYAQHTTQFLERESIETDAKSSGVSFRPLGVILGVMPWNFPLWQAFRFLVPTLCAGNTVVLKHASNVSGCALEIEKLLLASGFPDGAYKAILCSGNRVKELIALRQIKAVSLTGSGGAGKSVAEEAGKYLKKCVLELGGSNAFVVLADADVESAARLALKARFQNAGQSCIAAKRFIVVKEVYDTFKEAFATEIKKLKTGDPTASETSLAPLARTDLSEDLHKQVENSVKLGATVLLGGQHSGAIYQATLLENVRPGMPAFDEELFGPVAPLIRAEHEQEAIDLVNASSFGLGATICTANAQRAMALAAELEEGAVFVNELVKSDPRLPFGGVKDSGYGRELSLFGIREFVNAQTFYIK